MIEQVKASYYEFTSSLKDLCFFKASSQKMIISSPISLCSDVTLLLLSYPCMQQPQTAAARTYNSSSCLSQHDLSTAAVRNKVWSVPTAAAVPVVRTYVRTRERHSETAVLLSHPCKQQQQQQQYETATAVPLAPRG